MWWIGDPEGYPWEIHLVVFVSGEVMRMLHRGKKSSENSENVGTKVVKM